MFLPDVMRYHQSRRQVVHKINSLDGGGGGGGGGDGDDGDCDDAYSIGGMCMSTQMDMKYIYIYVHV